MKTTEQLEAEYVSVVRQLKATCVFNEYGDLKSWPKDDAPEFAEVNEYKKYVGTSRDSGGGYYETTAIYNGPGLLVSTVERWKKGLPVKTKWTLSTATMRSLAEQLSAQAKVDNAKCPPTIFKPDSEVLA